MMNEKWYGPKPSNHASKVQGKLNSNSGLVGAHGQQQSPSGGPDACLLSYPIKYKTYQIDHITDSNIWWPR